MKMFRVDDERAGTYPRSAEALMLKVLEFVKVSSRAVP
jgi:hypothetical protein